MYETENHFAIVFKQRPTYQGDNLYIIRSAYIMADTFVRFIYKVVLRIRTTANYNIKLES